MNNYVQHSKHNFPVLFKKFSFENSKGVPTIQFESSFQGDVAIGYRLLHLINEKENMHCDMTEP